MTEEICGVFFLIMLIIGVCALIIFADKKNAVKDTIYSIEQFIVILLIGCFIQKPYNEPFFALIGCLCFVTFPAFHFCLIEVRKGRLKWVSTKAPAFPQNEKNEEYTVTDNDVYIEIEKMASLKERGILSEEEFNEQKKKLLKI